MYGVTSVVMFPYFTKDEYLSLLGGSSKNKKGSILWFLFISYKSFTFYKNKKGYKLVKASTIALAGVALWIECQPANQMITGSIPSQGTCLGCRPGPQWGLRDRQPHIDVSFPLFLPPSPLSTSK